MNTSRLVVAAVAVTVGLTLAYTNLHVEPDAAPPARLAPFVDSARSLAANSLGPVGVVPLRFVEARCGADGSAVLVYESARSERFYAVVSAPRPSEAPDRVSTIREMSAAEFATSLYSFQSIPCN
jgi:hypothetical protein